MSHINNSRHACTPIPQGGGRNIFSRHRCLNLPEVLGDPPTPPPHPSKRLHLQFWRQNSNIWHQNSNILWQNSNAYRQNSNMWRQNSSIRPQIQILEYLYHQKPPSLYEENSRRRRFDTHPPPNGVSKKLKGPPQILQPKKTEKAHVRIYTHPNARKNTHVHALHFK